MTKNPRKGKRNNAFLQVNIKMDTWELHLNAQGKARSSYPYIFKAISNVDIGRDECGIEQSKYQEYCRRLMPVLVFGLIQNTTPAGRSGRVIHNSTSAPGRRSNQPWK